jgi:hypothetical protein
MIVGQILIIFFAAASLFSATTIVIRNDRAMKKLLRHALYCEVRPKDLDLTRIAIGCFMDHSRCSQCFEICGQS